MARAYWSKKSKNSSSEESTLLLLKVITCNSMKQSLVKIMLWMVLFSSKSFNLFILKFIHHTIIYWLKTTAQKIWICRGIGLWDVKLMNMWWDQANESEVVQIQFSFYCLAVYHLQTPFTKHSIVIGQLVLKMQAVEGCKNKYNRKLTNKQQICF